MQLEKNNTFLIVGNKSSDYVFSSETTGRSGRHFKVLKENNSELYSWDKLNLFMRLSCFYT